MGQAKNRGNSEQRAEQAKARIEAMKPETIVCNHCKAVLTDIVTLDARNMPGIEAAFAVHCPDCKHDTWAVKGHPDAVTAVALAMEDTHGGKVEVGIQPSKA